LRRAIDKTAQHFNNRDIGKIGRELVNKALAKAVADVTERTGATPRIDQSNVVIPFERRAAANA